MADDVVRDIPEEMVGVVEAAVQRGIYDYARAYWIPANGLCGGVLAAQDRMATNWAKIGAPFIAACIREDLRKAMPNLAVIPLPESDDTNERLGALAEWSLPHGVIGVYPGDNRPIYTSTDEGPLTADDAELEGAALIAAARYQRESESAR